MKIIVTGGAGFIGSHVVDKLVENNHDVIVVDNLRSGNKNNINPKAKFCKVDITSNKLESVFKKENPDIVYHLAAQINVRTSIEKPMEDAEINVKGTINILENCIKYNVKKIIYTSSGGAMYGEPDNNPATEDERVKPLCPYGLTKYIGEEYVKLYNRLHGLNYIVLRYGNVYGPRQDPKGEAGVISIFIEKMLNDEIPCIYGDGKQTRDYVYVGDVARANLLALNAEPKRREFNIGTGVETSVNKLFVALKEAMYEQLNKEHIAKHIDAVPGEVKTIALNCNLAKKELKWSSEKTLKEGISETVKYFIKKHK